MLTDAGGREHKAQFLSVELPRVSRRTHYVKFLMFSIDVPHRGEMSVPMRATAQADELPDDIDEVSVPMMLRAVHQPD